MISTFDNLDNIIRHCLVNTTCPSGFNEGVYAGDAFIYDNYGNLTQDKNKGITAITYNHLNLPKKIEFGSTDGITYLYNANGQKIQKTVVNSPNVSTVNYQGVFHYENGLLRFFATAEGYVGFSTRGYNYVYNYTDHLGNIRLSYMNDRLLGLLILDETHYYPFGLKQKGYEPPPAYATSYKYKFQNKEWQDELNLNVYDFGARQYMPDIVRTTTIDPLAEKFYSLSPQSFLNNNPLYFIDPTGESSLGFDWKPDENGNLIAEKGDNTATLATYLGTTTQDVSNRFTLKSTGEKLPENHEFKEGAKVELNNNMTRSIERSEGATTTEAIAGTKTNKDRVNDACVCDDASRLAVSGKEITPENAKKEYGNTFFNAQRDGYTEIKSFDEASFGKGIAVIAGQHVVTYYGKSNDGTPYVYSKGGDYKAEVIPLSKVVEQMKTLKMSGASMDNI